ncbi:leucine rich repeat containing protein / ankyrin repeat containing protein [Neospora caninum Liverpool]|uniref:Leucine rich repeat containing protein / ankyrin repeat containing protein n=1 Tax=Neospora caninum (strain Liverpool) TaxID=572307 RepID=F0VF93_NEOCL|nr:leucine rich repeat containing protein / ankyrin repeat containing protein [Neospora caninum Liverpool]CBZ52387.1 leucine rich repeat containing protein / ankyrin repeat containing protein [Neospora caninum Liverpool]CEL66358.1 TPA: leucine rich repeat containing protein / ankyrin repeat containing protein, putative [Neospora caninum Liverpool]|eukprot:XP_003882419.1 leucine rich repeat containing protein / ankyrin repeat containing protein [Neospora caninum Liverpool]
MRPRVFRPSSEEAAPTSASSPGSSAPASSVSRSASSSFAATPVLGRTASRIVTYHDILQSQSFGSFESRRGASPPHRGRCVPAVVGPPNSGVRPPGQVGRGVLPNRGLLRSGESAGNPEAQGKAFLMSLPSSGSRPPRKEEEATGRFDDLQPPPRDRLEGKRVKPAEAEDPLPVNGETAAESRPAARPRHQFVYTSSWEHVQRAAKEAGVLTSRSSLSALFPLEIPGRCITVFPAASSAVSAFDPEALDRPTVVVTLKKRKHKSDKSEDERDVPDEREEIRLAVPSATSLFAEGARPSTVSEGTRAGPGCPSQSGDSAPRGEEVPCEHACVLQISRVSAAPSTPPSPHAGNVAGELCETPRGRLEPAGEEGCTCLSPELVWGLPDVPGLCVVELRAADCGLRRFAPDFYAQPGRDGSSEREESTQEAADESAARCEGKRTRLPEGEGDVPMRLASDVALPKPVGRGDGFFAFLPFLQVLDLRSNNLAVLPGSVASLRCLRTLLLDGNALVSVPPVLLALPALAKLSLTSNFLTGFPTAPSLEEGVQEGDPSVAVAATTRKGTERRGSAAGREGVREELDGEEKGEAEGGADTRISPLRKLRLDSNFVDDLSFLLCEAPSLPPSASASRAASSEASESALFFRNLSQLHVHCNVFTLLPLGLHRLSHLRELSLDWLRYTSPPFPRVVRGTLMRQFFGRMRSLEGWLHAQAAHLLAQVEAEIKAEREGASTPPEGRAGASEEDERERSPGPETTFRRSGGESCTGPGETGSRALRFHFPEGNSGEIRGARGDKDHLLLCGAHPCRRFAALMRRVTLGGAERGICENPAGKAGVEATGRERRSDEGTEGSFQSPFHSRDQPEAAPLAPWAASELLASHADGNLSPAVPEDSPCGAALSAFSFACPCCISFLEFVHFFSTDVDAWLCPASSPSPQLLAAARHLASTFSRCPVSPASSCSASSRAPPRHPTWIRPSGGSSDLPPAVAGLLFSLCVVEVRLAVSRAFAADVVFARDAKQRTRLHVAALEGHEGVARALLQGSADFNALDVDAASPLFLAVKEGQFNVVALLAEEAARRLRQAKGVTGGLRASRVAPTAGESGGDTASPGVESTVLLLPYTVPAGHVPDSDASSCSGVLLSPAASGQSCPSAPKSPSPASEEQALSPFQRSLLASYRVLNSGAGIYGTPLHVATVMFEFPLCALLLHAGADPTAVDADGNTALHVLFSIFDKGSPDLAAIVLDPTRRLARRRKPAGLGLTPEMTPRADDPSHSASSRGIRGQEAQRADAAEQRRKDGERGEASGRETGRALSGGQEACVLRDSRSPSDGASSPSSRESEYARVRAHFLALLGNPLPPSVEVGLLLLRHPRAHAPDARVLPLESPCVEKPAEPTEKARRGSAGWETRNRRSDDPAFTSSSSTSPSSFSSSSFSSPCSSLLSSEVRLCIRANQLNNDMWGAIHLAARRGQTFAFWFLAELAEVTDPRCMRGTCAHAERVDFLAPLASLLAAARLFTRAAEAGESPRNVPASGSGERHTDKQAGERAERDRDAPRWRVGVPCGDMWVEGKRGQARETSAERMTRAAQAGGAEGGGHGRSELISEKDAQAEPEGAKGETQAKNGDKVPTSPLSPATPPEANPPSLSSSVPPPNPFLLAAAQTPALRAVMREREAGRRQEERQEDRPEERQENRQEGRQEEKEADGRRQVSVSLSRGPPSPRSFSAGVREEERLRFLWDQLQSSSAGVVFAQAVTAAAVALTRRSGGLSWDSSRQPTCRSEDRGERADALVPGILAEVGGVDILQYTTQTYVCPFAFDFNLRGGTHLWTALHLAAHAGNVQVVQQLLEGGACVSVLNRQGRSAQAVARGQHQQAIERTIHQQDVLDLWKVTHRTARSCFAKRFSRNQHPSHPPASSPNLSFSSLQRDEQPERCLSASFPSSHALTSRSSRPEILRRSADSSASADFLSDVSRAKPDCSPPSASPAPSALAVPLTASVSSETRPVSLGAPGGGAPATPVVLQERDAAKTEEAHYFLVRTSENDEPPERIELMDEEEFFGETLSAHTSAAPSGPTAAARRERAETEGANRQRQAGEGEEKGKTGFDEKELSASLSTWNDGVISPQLVSSIIDEVSLSLRAEEAIEEGVGRAPRRGHKTEEAGDDSDLAVEKEQTDEERGEKRGVEHAGTSGEKERDAQPGNVPEPSVHPAMTGGSPYTRGRGGDCRLKSEDVSDPCERLRAPLFASERRILAAYSGGSLFTATEAAFAAARVLSPRVATSPSTPPASSSCFEETRTGAPPPASPSPPRPLSSPNGPRPSSSLPCGFLETASRPLAQVALDALQGAAVEGPPFRLVSLLSQRLLSSKLAAFQPLFGRSREAHAWLGGERATTGAGESPLRRVRCTDTPAGTSKEGEPAARRASRETSGEGRAAKGGRAVARLSRDASPCPTSSPSREAEDIWAGAVVFPPTGETGDAWQELPQRQTGETRRGRERERRSASSSRREPSPEGRTSFPHVRAPSRCAGDCLPSSQSVMAAPGEARGRSRRSSETRSSASLGTLSPPFSFASTSSCESPCFLSCASRDSSPGARRSDGDESPAHALSSAAFCPACTASAYGSDDCLSPLEAHRGRMQRRDRKTINWEESVCAFCHGCALETLRRDATAYTWREISASSSFSEEDTLFSQALSSARRRGSDGNQRVLEHAGVHETEGENAGVGILPHGDGQQAVSQRQDGDFTSSPLSVPAGRDDSRGRARHGTDATGSEELRRAEGPGETRDTPQTVKSRDASRGSSRRADSQRFFSHHRHKERAGSVAASADLFASSARDPLSRRAAEPREGGRDCRNRDLEREKPRAVREKRHKRAHRRRNEADRETWSLLQFAVAHGNEDLSMLIFDTLQPREKRRALLMRTPVSHDSLLLLLAKGISPADCLRGLASPSPSLSRQNLFHFLMSLDLGDSSSVSSVRSGSAPPAGTRSDPDPRRLLLRQRNEDGAFPLLAACMQGDVRLLSDMLLYCSAAVCGCERRRREIAQTPLFEGAEDSVDRETAHESEFLTVRALLQCVIAAVHGNQYAALLRLLYQPLLSCPACSLGTQGFLCLPFFSSSTSVSSSFPPSSFSVAFPSCASPCSLFSPVAGATSREGPVPRFPRRSSDAGVRTRGDAKETEKSDKEQLSALENQILLLTRLQAVVTAIRKGDYRSLSLLLTSGFFPPPAVLAAGLVLSRLTAEAKDNCERPEVRRERRRAANKQERRQEETGERNEPAQERQKSTSEPSDCETDGKANRETHRRGPDGAVLARDKALGEKPREEGRSACHAGGAEAVRHSFDSLHRRLWHLATRLLGAENLTGVRDVRELEASGHVSSVRTASHGRPTSAGKNGEGEGREKESSPRESSRDGPKRFQYLKREALAMLAVVSTRAARRSSRSGDVLLLPLLGAHFLAAVSSVTLCPVEPFSSASPASSPASAFTLEVESPCWRQSAGRGEPCNEAVSRVGEATPSPAETARKDLTSGATPPREELHADLSPLETLSSSLRPLADTASQIEEGTEARVTSSPVSPSVSLSLSCELRDIGGDSGRSEELGCFEETSSLSSPILCTGGASPPFPLAAAAVLGPTTVASCFFTCWDCGAEVSDEEAKATLSSLILSGLSFLSSSPSSRVSAYRVPNLLPAAPLLRSGSADCPSSPAASSVAVAALALALHTSGRLAASESLCLLENSSGDRLLISFASEPSEDPSAQRSRAPSLILHKGGKPSVSAVGASGVFRPHQRAASQPPTKSASRQSGGRDAKLPFHSPANVEELNCLLGAEGLACQCCGFFYCPACIVTLKRPLPLPLLNVLAARRRQPLLLHASHSSPPYELRDWLHPKQLLEFKEDAGSQIPTKPEMCHGDLADDVAEPTPLESSGDSAADSLATMLEESRSPSFPEELSPGTSVDVGEAETRAHARRETGEDDEPRTVPGQSPAAWRLQGDERAQGSPAEERGETEADRSYEPADGSGGSAVQDEMVTANDERSCELTPGSSPGIELPGKTDERVDRGEAKDERRTDPSPSVFRSDAAVSLPSPVGDGGGAAPGLGEATPLSSSSLSCSSPSQPWERSEEGERGGFSHPWLRSAGLFGHLKSSRKDKLPRKSNTSAASPGSSRPTFAQGRDGSPDAGGGPADAPAGVCTARRGKETGHKSFASLRSLFPGFRRIRTNPGAGLHSSPRPGEESDAAEKAKRPQPRCLPVQAVRAAEHASVLRGDSNPSETTRRSEDLLSPSRELLEETTPHELLLTATSGDSPETPLSSIAPGQSDRSRLPFPGGEDAEQRGDNARLPCEASLSEKPGGRHRISRLQSLELQRARMHATWIQQKHVLAYLPLFRLQRRLDVLRRLAASHQAEIDRGRTSPGRRAQNAKPPNIGRRRGRRSHTPGPPAQAAAQTPHVGGVRLCRHCAAFYSIL